MILVIDHYDSFVETLARYVREAGFEVRIINQDAMGAREIATIEPTAIIFSPGPGGPDNTGVSVPLIKLLSAHVPMLGVCLGHLAMAAAFGGTLARAVEPLHGKASPVTHDASALFDGLENPFDAGRYHALIVAQLPACLTATAHSEAGEIMALEHASAPLYGVQFHPESVLTPQGRKLISNFLTLATAFGGAQKAARG